MEDIFKSQDSHPDTKGCDETGKKRDREKFDGKSNNEKYGYDKTQNSTTG